MAEEENAVPEPERYYVEHVSPTSGEEGVSMAAFQEAMNAGTRQSWKLVSVVNEPAGRGVMLVWDQQGFISG